MITIRNKYLLHPFGFRNGPIILPVAGWWKCFFEGTWYRDFCRGYRDDDAKSLIDKLSYPLKPGCVLRLSRREHGAFIGLYGRDKWNNSRRLV